MQAPARPYRVAAIVLAAGQSRRMGSNKLLASVGGKPLVRHPVEAALDSRANPVIVVTGNEGEQVKAALSPLALLYSQNDLFSEGLSSSLKRGVNSLAPDTDAAVVLLGDMPGTSSATINDLIAAFDPAAGRTICVPVWAGHRGNPVLWGRALFGDILALNGDAGARTLMSRYPDQVHEVAARDDGVLIDLDTPEALADYQKR